MVRGFERGYSDVMSIPSDAICFFRDGDSVCCVRGDFVNLQASLNGWGWAYAEAYIDLLVAEGRPQSEIDAAVERKQFGHCHVSKSLPI